MGQLDLTKLPDKGNTGLDLSKLPDKEVKEVKKETPNPGTFRMRGSTFDDPNATWWDKAKDVLGIMTMPSSPDAAALADFEQNVVSPAVPRIPLVKEGTEQLADWMTPRNPKTTGQQAYKDVVGGGLIGVGEALSDPRSYILPHLFEFGAPPRGMRAPSKFGKAEIFDENIPFDRGTKNVTPRPPEKGKFLRESSAPGDKLKPYGSELPPNTPRRFLGNGEVDTPLAARESKFKSIQGPTATDIKERGPGWVDVEDPSKGKKLRFTKEGTLVDTETGEETISQARTKAGGIKIGQNINRAVDELTTGYSGDLPAIMAREGLQNAIDAVRHLEDKGNVTFNITDPYGGEDASIIITDNGKGMTMKELQTVFSDLHESGKTREGGATGGKGVGKVSYMLGGKHFTVETVTKEGPNIVKHTMQGNPEEWKTEVKPKTELMPPDTPTGTTIKTTLLPDQRGYYAKEMVENIQKYSRGLSTNIRSQIGKYQPMKDTDFPSVLHKNDTPIATRDFNHSNIDITIPHSVTKEDKGRNYIKLKVLNNGMYQYNDTHYLGEEVKGLPDEVLINVRPKVEEGSKDYPFPVQRESVKEKVKEEITGFLDETLISPRRMRAQSKLKEIYENLAVIPSTGGHRFRNSILFDPGDRLTSAEKNALVNSPYIKQLSDYLDSFIEESLIKAGNEEWHKKLEGVGIVLDPNMHGVHIPNPESKGKKSIILINPFSHAQYEKSPFDTAIATAVTTLHELAHIGREDPAGVIKFDREDLMHPDVGLFMQTYYKEVQDHGGLDLGHGFGFVKRLGEIYAKTGIEQPIRFATDFTRLLSGTDARGNLAYTSEFQDLLRVYDESRGRGATTEDYLSGTGVKQVTPNGRRGGASSNAGGNGAGVPRKPIIDRIGQYQRKPPDSADLAFRQKVEDDGIILKAMGLFKGLKATADLGPVLRQGIAYTGRPFWRKALRQQFISYASEGGHQKFLEDTKMDPLNQPKWSDGSKAMSWYEMAKVDITTLGGRLAGQEEAIMGIDLAEKAFALPQKLIPGLPNPARASGRAYSDSILTLRRGASQVLYDGYKKLYESTKKTAKSEKESQEAESYNPDNPLVAQNIGIEINRASGRGRLSTPELKLPRSRFLGPASGAKLARSLSAEPVGDAMNLSLFSPRLFASRIQNIQKVLNPFMWASAPPPMRWEYLKQLLSIAIVVGTGNTLMSLFGAETGTDSNSPDFMKSRFGKGKKGASIDFTGGYSRFATLGSRISTQKVTSGNGRRFKVGQPPMGDTMSLIEDFGEGLAAPTFQMAMQLLNRKEFGNKPLDLTNPNPFDNSAGKALLTPMIAQDLYELLASDPSYVPLIFPDALGAAVTVYGQ